jgi:amino acid transporter
MQMAMYGLGSMIGSGIYGLLGQAAAQVGNAVWLAFLIALAAALLTALSYASLGSRYPRAGGAAFFAERAYRWPLLSFVVGLAVVCAGITSVATQSRVFAANIAPLFGSSGSVTPWIALGFLLLLAGIVFRGIRESMWVNVGCTLIEAAGLLIVIAMGLRFWGDVDYTEVPATAPDQNLWLTVLNGAVLTFFAFIGFEDTVNVAEECRNPQRTVPLGLILAMSLAAALYIAVSITAVSVVPWPELAAAASPLTEVIARAAPGFPPIVFTLIAVFAVANTALVNYVTASRMIYGMAEQKLLPRSLGKVHPTTRTPHIAISALLLVLAPLAIFGTIADLAAATVLLLLIVFALVNGALVSLKRRPDESRGLFEVPLLVPALGGLICIALVVIRVGTGNWRAPALAASLLVGILGIHTVLHRRAAA